MVARGVVATNGVVAWREARERPYANQRCFQNGTILTLGSLAVFASDLEP